MDRLGLFVIGLIFGGGFGFLVAAGNGITLDGHDHAMDHDDVTMGGMDHGEGHAHDAPLDLPAEGAPTVAITLLPDPVAGYNLRVVATDFEFAPAAAGFTHTAGQGHAHVYVNGKKLARLYGAWMHIATLPGGEAEVQVTLNANDHRTLTVGGQPISAKATVTVP